MGIESSPHAAPGGVEELGRPGRRRLLKTAGIFVAAVVANKLLPGVARATEEDISSAIEKLRRETRALFTDPTFVAQIEAATTLEDPAIVEMFRRLALVTGEMIEESSLGLPPGMHAGSRVLQENGSYGNSTVLRMRDSEGRMRFVEVTAAHVVAGEFEETVSAEKKDKWYTTYPKGPDIAIRELSEREVGGETLLLAARQATHNISGDIGSVLSVDQDLISEQKLSGPILKRFASFVSPAVAQKIFELASTRNEGVMNTYEDLWRTILLQESAQHARAQRFIVIPATQVTSEGPDPAPAKGCSGSALLYVPPGARGVHFGGVLTAIGTVFVGNVAYYVALVHDHQTVRAEIEKHLFQLPH